MAISIDMLMWKAESHWVTPPEKEPWATDGEKKRQTLPGWSP